MKVAVVGKGKTGQSVINLLKENHAWANNSPKRVSVSNQCHTHTDNSHLAMNRSMVTAENQISDAFDSQNLVTVEKLNKADVAIVFVEAEILKQILPILMQSKVAVVCGTTGFDYSDNFKQKVKQSEQTWVVANNFSLSMVLIKEMLNTLGNLQNLVSGTRFQLTETHHVHKLDAPSGTAISWQSWLNVKDCPIESIRKEDVKGEHLLQVHNKHESIELRHIAHDRRLFAEGALWSARFVYENKVSAGFYRFDELVRSVSWQ